MILVIALFAIVALLAITAGACTVMAVLTRREPAGSQPETPAELPASRLDIGPYLPPVVLSAREAEEFARLADQLAAMPSTEETTS